MTEKEYKRVAKQLEKLCKNLRDLMSVNRPQDIFNVLVGHAPAADVDMIALFVINMQASFILRVCETVREYDAQCATDAKECSECDAREGCPDRKDGEWIH